MAGDLNSIRVVIADERAAFRQALRTMLEPESDFAIVGEASDADVVTDLAKQLDPDVVVIDFLLFHSLKSLAGQPAFKTLVTVPAFERTDFIKAFRHGARAVVPKLSPSHVWRESIRSVGAGQYWLVNEGVAILVESLQEHCAGEAETRLQNEYKLTPREVAIMDKIAQGHSNKEVGHAFSICERTVKHHLTSIFTKVGVSSRLELALVALHNRPTDAAQRRKGGSEQTEDSGPTRHARRRASAE